jgi:hypothetical protein
MKISIFTTDSGGHASVSEYDASDVRGALNFVRATPLRILTIVLGVELTEETLAEILKDKEAT